MKTVDKIKKTLKTFLTSMFSIGTKINDRG